ncbi:MULTISPECIES: hypothetical protein [Acidiphilium]|uniref:hypothetical protein n=1 Tax=Acidiphilium TaxID=522 RepID=UPI001115758D|nr:MULTISPECIES: hypothetical protein [Acidiphilium]
MLLVSPLVGSSMMSTACLAVRRASFVIRHRKIPVLMAKGLRITLDALELPSRAAYKCVGRIPDEFPWRI